MKLYLPAQGSHDLAAKADDRAAAGIIHQRDLARLTGFETHRSARRNIQAHAAGLSALEYQRRVDLCKVVMAAHLHRAIAAIGHLERDGASADIENDVAIRSDDFAWNHDPHLMGWWTVTSLVPSGNVASTWISWIISATPSMTCSRVSICAPDCMSCATLRPSRAP